MGGDWLDNPSDEQILSRALSENRGIVTLDKDFGELAIVFGRRHAGIIRIVDFPISRHASICLRAIELHEDELVRGALITAEPGRLRIRQSPSSEGW